MSAFYAAKTEVARVLVVNASPAEQAVYRRALPSPDYELVFAKDGWDAMVRVWDQRPGIVFAALGADRVDTFKVCEIITRHSQFRHVPVLLVMPPGSLFERSQAVLAGASDCLLSPLTEDQVMGAVLAYSG